MAKRRFELPGIQDLSKEQDTALARPVRGQHLIVGGPGTGKSVLALLRARRHDRQRQEYLFLVFNHLLNRASSQLYGKGLTSRTWDSWFREVLRTSSGRVPVLGSTDGGYQPIDWAGVEEIIHDLPKGETSKARPLLVIDEGQDMPRQFYEALANLGFEDFFVVADQNQQITEANSTRRDIENCLAIETEEVIELRRNYRNGYRVAKLANEFYTGDPASPRPELPKAAPSDVPRLFEYDERDIDTVARRILLFADRDPQQLVGVIAPNNRVRKRYLCALRSVQVKVDNPRPIVWTFHGDDRGAVVFEEGGIAVINAQSCKGLEFDAVVLADVDEHFVSRRDPDEAKRLFYVMVARARDRVFMFMKRGGRKEILRVLPPDREILRREEM